MCGWMMLHIPSCLDIAWWYKSRVRGSRSSTVIHRNLSILILARLRISSWKRIYEFIIRKTLRHASCFQWWNNRATVSKNIRLFSNKTTGYFYLIVWINTSQSPIEVEGRYLYSDILSSRRWGGMYILCLQMPMNVLLSRYFSSSPRNEGLFRYARRM